MINSEKYAPNSCDYCDQRLCCSNIYVALKIIESELRHCKNEQLTQRFLELSRELCSDGYDYPLSLSHSTCDLANDAASTEGLLLRLRALLDDIRADIAGAAAEMTLKVFK